MRCNELAMFLPERSVVHEVFFCVSDDMVEYMDCAGFFTYASDSIMEAFGWTTKCNKIFFIVTVAVTVTVTVTVTVIRFVVSHVRLRLRLRLRLIIFI
jgi:hypothetical protein